MSDLKHFNDQLDEIIRKDLKTIRTALRGEVALGVDPEAITHYQPQGEPLTFEGLRKTFEEIKTRQGYIMPEALKSPADINANIARDYLAQAFGGARYSCNEIQIIEIPVPMMAVQKRRHHRKSSRRWQKKYLKRFGLKMVPAISPEEEMKIIFDQERAVAYCYPRAVRELREQLPLYSHQWRF